MEKVLVCLNDLERSCYKVLIKRKNSGDAWESFRDTITVDLALKDEQNSDRKLDAWQRGS